MIAELHEHAVVRLAGEAARSPSPAPPAATLAGGGLSTAGAEAAAGRGREIADFAVHGLFRHANLGGRVLVGLRRQACRQLQPADVLIVGEAGLDRDVTEIGVVGHRHDAVGSLVVASIASVKLRPLAVVTSTTLWLSMGAGVRELRRRIERRADNRERVMEDLRAPVLRRRVRDARRVAVGRDVVADLAVDAVHLLLRRLALEVREVRRARLFDSGPVTCARRWRAGSRSV